MNEKLSEKVHKSIRNDIIEGKLTGKEFLSESEIAAKYGVSKGPVKEAMHNLCQEGYLISYPRKGYMVNSYSMEDYKQVKQVRLWMEQLCVKLAIENATDEEILSLRETISVESQGMNPYKTYNTLFHMKLAEITGNKYIGPILHNLVGIASREMIVKVPNANEMHEKIIQSLLERDIKKAQKYIKLDIE